jgi:uncharacterized protein (DUF2336 family)
LLAAAKPENQAQIQRALADIATEVGRDAADARDFRRADNIVVELNRRAKLTEAALLGFIRDRQYEEMTATLALYCGVKSELIESLLKSVRQDGLMVACRAAKLSWPTVELILQNRFPHHSIPKHELIAAKDAFLVLSEPAAQRSMRFMHVQQTTKKQA